MLLEVSELEAKYRFLQVLWGVSLEVDEGEIVALLGPNGAGKTTTLRSIAGFVSLMGGSITFRGESIKNCAPETICRDGIALVSENMNLFPDMSVRENLLLGGYTLDDRSVRRERIAAAIEMFPRLGERQHQRAGTLSGGERKMLAIARAMMLKPAIYLVDEPSLGLSPRLTDEVFAVLSGLRDEGHSILVVEQNVPATLDLADRAYVLERGEIRISGSTDELIGNERIRNVYMGVS